MKRLIVIALAALVPLVLRSAPISAAASDKDDSLIGPPSSRFT